VILLFYTYPMFVVAIATLTGRERLTRGHLLAVAMSIAGLVCVVAASGRPTSPNWHRAGAARLGLDRRLHPVRR